ncbi:MAG: rRNA maturation RNase YbeY [Puniceicoccales bacterium]|jgi:probable rRNA maturation factor|nr:rRNA maturation RNase YbeY [Puniceicoccales bacterium]
MHRKVRIFNAVRRLLLDRDEVCRVFFVLDEFFFKKIPDGEISVAFLDGKAMEYLHQKFLDDAFPTDVITFSGDPASSFAGEICVSVDYAEDYVRANGGEFCEELLLYVVHGWLHLSGVDDKEKSDAKYMRQCEKDALSLLRSNGVNPRFTVSELISKKTGKNPMAVDNL